ncbi:MAG: PorP/SprF family type IX secretion system membrane protein [Bacteroidota bacterium]
MKTSGKYVMKGIAMITGRLKVALLSLFVLLFIAPSVEAQDNQYSQFTNLPIYYNPAYTGLEQGMRAKFAYRRQWVKMPHDFKAMNFNTDIAARGIPGSGGLGIMFDSHNEGGGLIKRNSFGLNLAVRIPIMENVVSQFGMAATFVQKYIDWSRLVFSDQLDENYGNIYTSDFVPPSSNKVNFPDFTIGGLFRFKRDAGRESTVIGTFGLAIHHLFEPNESFINMESNLPIKFVGLIDFQVQPDEGGRNSSNGFKYNPAIIYMNQAGMDSWSIGMNVYKFPLYVGAWYRSSEFQFLNNDALIVLIGLNSNFGGDTRMKLVYSYDVMLTDLTKATGGSHELTLIFEMDDMRLFGNNPGFNHNRMDRMGREVECSSF